MAYYGDGVGQIIIFNAVPVLFLKYYYIDKLKLNYSVNCQFFVSILSGFFEFFWSIKSVNLTL